ncbi:Uma2 family endonuclease [Kitasatospora sp. NPDC058218]|uniref:Uma2 family endonuclease n=1 Tax=Kitasatospora sp. NPDC058218 TaxID=3346385 RepID=UPI0036DA49B4
MPDEQQSTGSAWDVLAGVRFPPGHRVEITAGKVTMTPRTAASAAIARAVAAQAGEQSAGHGTVLAEAVVDFPSARYGYAPDVALVAPGARPGARGRFGWRDLEAVLEAVPRSQQDDDFVRKHRFFAECGIPLYVLVDPAVAVCTVYSAPQPAGTYREAERVPFGNDVFLPLAERTLVLRTDDFPVESPTPGAEPGGGRGIVDG